MNPYLEIVLRSTVVYAFVIIAIRVFGKNEITQFSVIDLVLIMLISNSVQNAMVGSNISLEGGILSAGSLFILHFLLKQLTYRNPFMKKMIQGNPVLLVHQGQVIRRNIIHEQISIDELETAAREHGVASLTDVDLAILETDGTISILSNEYQSHSNKKRKSSKAFPK